MIRNSLERRSNHARRDAAGALQAFATTAALACSCAPPTVEELLQSAPAIFNGVATESVPATQACATGAGEETTALNPPGSAGD